MAKLPEYPPIGPIEDDPELVPAVMDEATQQSIIKDVQVQDDLAMAICKKIETGSTVIECIAWLMHEHGAPIQLAGLILDRALNRTLGQMDHNAWTAQYRLMASDLYKRAMDAGNHKLANTVLANMVKLQHLAQSVEHKGRDLTLKEETLKSVVEKQKREEQSSKENGEAPKQQGFRVLIETVAATQSTPARNAQQDAEVLEPKPD